MNAHYPSITAVLSRVGELEKTAAADGDYETLSEELKLAQLSSMTFDAIRVRSGAYKLEKEAAAASFVAFVLDLRDTHEALTGTKLAADGTMIAALLVKLGTAVYLDGAIDPRNDILRSLNREYAVSLVRGLLE